MKEELEREVGQDCSRVFRRLTPSGLHLFFENQEIGKGWRAEDKAGNLKQKKHRNCSPQQDSAKKYQLMTSKEVLQTYQERAIARGSALFQ